MKKFIKDFLPLIIFAVLTISIFSISVCKEHYFNKNTQPSIEAVDASYRDSVKQMLIEEVDNYITTNYPKSKLTPDSLVNNCLEHNFNIAFALAQGVAESGLGSAGLAKRTNSVWNVGAHDSWTVQQIKKNGFTYPTQDHSIIPYIQLVKNKYMGPNKTHKDLLKKYVVNGTNKRYATNPKYELHLRTLYDSISRSTNINELQELWILIGQYPVVKNE